MNISESLSENFKWKMRKTQQKCIFYLDAGQNVSHDDLLTIVLWEILAEFYHKKENNDHNSDWEKKLN